MQTRANKQKSAQNLNITNSIEVTIIGVARGAPPIEMRPMIVVSSVSVSFSIFEYNSIRVQQ